MGPLLICKPFFALFLQTDDYKNVNRWLATLDSRKAVQRGLRVNGFGANALSERHSKDDFSVDEY